MGTFTFVPAGDVPQLPEALDRRIRAECQSVQSAHLSGRKVYWQLRAQADPDRPLFARALDTDHNGLLYTLCFGPDGRLTPNRLLRETSTAIELADPFMPARFLCLQAARETATAFGLSVASVTAHRAGSCAIREENPVRIGITVVDLPVDTVPLESQILTRCMDVIKNAGHALQNLEVGLKKAEPLQDPTTRPNLSRQSSSASVAAESAPVVTKRSSRSSLHTPSGTPPRSPLPRRTSSNLASQSQSQSQTRLTSPPVTTPKEPPTPSSPVHTIASVSQEFFQRDYATHVERSNNAKLAVILHDSCYGHRYSRPRTSKANLSTIVERPERILAITLGVSVAYVLLGGRYASSQHPPHPNTSPDSVPFVIRKSNRFVPLTSPVVTNVHGTKWMNELKVMCNEAEAKLTANGKELVRPVDGETDKPKFHEGDLYLCAETLDALEGALGGVLDAIDTVFDVSETKTAFVGIRPPGHHCSASYPAGFCWLNNVYVGISHAAAVHGLTHVAVIDFDLHHGDGSQAITWAHNAAVAALPKNAPFSKRTAIGYFSLHDINSYPCEWGDDEKVQAASLCIENAHGQTIWNTHLQPWKTNAEFWALYEKRYAVLIHKARDFLRHHHERLGSLANAPQPRGMIFISAGFDASEWEGQGMQRHKVNVPTDFYERFTRDIMAMSREMGLGVDGRVVSVLEGGYSDRALMSGVMSHLSGMVDRVSKVNGTEPSQDFTDRMEGLAIGNETPVQDLGPQAWAPAALDEIEAAVNPTPPPPPKKPRGPLNPTYSTPTQSSTAKLHVSVSVRRPSSMNEPVYQPTVNEIAPSIGWAIASQEFCKVLVPNRQTGSCRPEDLNAEATRVRRNRQSAIGVATEPVAPAEDAKPMQLRVRKEKTPAAEPKGKSTNRRTTLGASEISNLTGVDSTPKTVPKPRRRVSVASTTLSTTEETPDLPEPGPRRSRRSSVSATRSSSPSGSRAGSSAKASRPSSRPGSPSKPRAPKKAPVKKTPATTPSSGTTSASTAPLDTLTEGVKKMSIKLNLPPKPETEPKKKPVRAPRKTPTTPKEKKPASTPKKTAVSSGTAPQPSEPQSVVHATIESPTTLTPVEKGGDTTALNSNSTRATTEVPAPAGPSPKRPSPSRTRSGTPKAMTPKITAGADVKPWSTKAEPSFLESRAGQEQASKPLVPPPASTVSVPTSFGTTQPLGRGLTMNQSSQGSIPDGMRRTLPTFTSTSPIPFGMPKTAGPPPFPPKPQKDAPSAESVSPKREEQADVFVSSIPAAPEAERQ